MNKNNPKIEILTNNDELGNALKHLLKYNAGINNADIKQEIDNKATLVILDIHAQDIVKNYGEYLRNPKHRRIPFTIIIGIEKKLEDYDKLFLGGADDILAPIRLLTSACGNKYYKYFCLPYEVLKLSTFLLEKIKKQPYKLPNPFKELSKVKVLQDKIYSFKVDFFEEAGKYAIPKYRKTKRLEGFHEKKNIDHLLAMQFYDLAIAHVKYKSQERKELNVLLIENKPDRVIEELGPSLQCCLKKIEGLFDGYKFWIYPKKADYQFLKESLNSILDDPGNKQKVESEIFNKVEPIDNSKAKNSSRTKENVSSFEKIDLILIDIFLGEGAELSGLDFLHLFTLLYPEIPAFILSGNEDTEVIGKTIKGKADYYILKKHIFSLPFLFYEYISELGILIDHIKDPKLRRNLIGNIRYWRFKKEFLWFGDKCYHMINHSYNHIENDWKIANQIVPPVLDYLEMQDKDKKLTDEEIYSLCMAVWLHDIGHKGNEHYGEPHEIRDLHGLISAEIFMKHPESYGIFGYDGSNVSPYYWADFGRPKTAPQLIRERWATLEAAGHLIQEKGEFSIHINKLTILEKICLISIYHKSNFPLDEDDLRNFRKKGKRIPLDCYCDKNKDTSPIHLKSIADVVNDQNILKLTALFRFIDGLDINQNRVGDDTEKSVKKLTIKRDIKYQILKLRREAERIRDTHLKDTGMEKRFFTLFYEKTIDDIQKDKWISEELKKEQRQFLDTLGVDFPLENYYMLTEYVEFISVQEGHFGLHNSIDELKINTLPPNDETKGKPRFQIKYESRKKDKILDNKDKVEVKERGQKEGRTIRDHLLGEREQGKEHRKKDGDGCVRRELNNGKKYLDDWFDLKHTKIFLDRADGDPWPEPEPKKKSKCAQQRGQ